MKLLYEKKGMTLVEIIVAIAILGVIVVSLFNIYTNGIMNIETMGQRSEAVYEHAQLIMEEIHQHEDIDHVASQAELEAIITSVLSANYIPAEYTSFAYTTPPSAPTGSEIVSYGVGTRTAVSGVYGYPYTIVVFYKDGKQSVKLSSFIPEGGI